MKRSLILFSFGISLFLSCKKNQEEQPASELKDLTSIKPTASIGDTLEVNGENLPTAPGSLSVYFGSEKAAIISQSSLSVKFVVPVLKSKECEVSLKNSNNAVLKKQTFILEAVHISSISSKAKSGEPVIVFGKNFQFLNNIKVIVNDQELNPNTVTSSSLTFNLPESVYPGRISAIGVKDQSTSTALSTSTTVADKWVRVAYSPFVFRGLFEAFVFKDEGYALSYNKEGIDKKAFFYKLNPNTYKYTAYEVPIATTGALATPTNIYCIQNRTNIYRYDMIDTSSKFITRVPLPDVSIYSRFAIGEELYMFMASSTPLVPPTSFKFYKYIIATNTWTQLSSLSDLLKSAKVTVIGDKAYLINDYRRFYVYDSQKNTWTNQPFPINPAGQYLTAYYSHHGKVYALLSPSNGQETIYEYTPETGQWKNLGVLRKEGSSNFYGFFIGNKHFIGGSKHDPFSSQLFESDASYLFD